MVHKELLRIAYEKAKKSPDPSTQNCALLVDDRQHIVVSGINRFPDGVMKGHDRLIKPKKYAFVEHAERIAFFTAARLGIKTQGLMLVSPWFPCAECARGIIQSGIVHMVVHKQACDRVHAAWEETLQHARIMLGEAGIQISVYDGKVGVVGVLFNGEKWDP